MLCTSNYPFNIWEQGFLGKKQLINRLALHYAIMCTKECETLFDRFVKYYTREYIGFSNVRFESIDWLHVLETIKQHLTFYNCYPVLT